MLTVVIKASNLVDGKKVPAGECNEKKPENVQEAIDLWGEKAFLKMAWESNAIKVQATLRNGGDSKTTQGKKIFAEASADPEGELARMLKDRGYSI